MSDHSEPAFGHDNDAWVEDDLPTVLQYGLTPPGVPLHPQYDTFDAEWHESLIASQEVGAVLVGHILAGERSGYLRVAAGQGLDAYGEVAAISDYVALAHPTRSWWVGTFGPSVTTASTALDGGLAEDLAYAGMEWLILWTQTDPTRWTPGLPLHGPRCASWRLRELLDRDGIDLVLAQVKRAVPLVCDTATLHHWLGQMMLGPSDDEAA